MMNVLMNPDISESLSRDFMDVQEHLKHVGGVGFDTFNIVREGTIKSIQRGRLSRSVRSQDATGVLISEVNVDKSLATFSCSTHSGSNCVFGMLDSDGLAVVFRNTDEDNYQWLECSWEVIEYV